MSKRMGKFSRIGARALLLVFAFVASTAQPAMGQSSTTEEMPFAPLVALLPEPDPVPKCRYISFQPPRQGAPVALRVTLTDGRAPFNALSGLYKWVDAPTEIDDASNPSGPVYVGRLTDRPVFVDWSTIDVLHVGDRYIFPDTVYEVQAIAPGCSLHDMNCYSPALEVRTARWGDVTGRRDEAGRRAPDGVINFTDIGGIVEAFKSIPSAPPLVCCDLDGEVPSASINFSDIGYAVEAFKGVEYPFAEGLMECYREPSEPTGPSEPTEPSPPCEDCPEPGFLQLQIAPIDGLTTAWHDAPSLFAIPLGTTVRFLHRGIPPDATVRWCGVNPPLGAPAGAAAQRTFDRVGPQLIHLTVTNGQGSLVDRTVVVDVIDVPVGQIKVGPIHISVVPFELDENATNYQTVEYFFADESIASLRNVGDGAYRTSVDRTLHLQVDIDPPVLAQLLEWRMNGQAVALGPSIARAFDTPGTRTIAAGPPADPGQIEIETYKVTITSHRGGQDIVPEGEPITFEAVTDPPGYEDEITWLSSTTYGTGTPVLSQGPTFTVLFDDTWGVHEDGYDFQWLGVKADNAVFGQDQKGVTCHRCDPWNGEQEFEVISDDPESCYSHGGSPTPPPCYEWDDICDPDPPICDPCCDDCSTSDDPVHLFSGEKLEQVVDLRIPGRGFDFVLSRTYRNQTEIQTIQGYNWGMSYDLRFERDDSKLVLHTGELRRDEFHLRPDGSYHRGEYFQRVEISDEPDGSITVRKADGSTWTFARLDDPTKSGRIVSMVDRNGNTMSFEYDGPGRLIKIHDTLDTDAHNRDINFAYNTDGFLEFVEDWTGRQVKYEYYQDADADGSFGDLKSVTTPEVTGTPTGNNFPDGKQTKYKYSKGLGGNLDHNLTSITDPKAQKYKVLTYDADDKVIRQELGGDIIDYVYVPQTPSADNLFATMLTIINDRVGNVEHRFFDQGHRMVILREFTGRAPNPRAPTTLNINMPENPLRPADPPFGDPPFFETLYNRDANSQLGFSLAPNGDSVLNTRDDGNDDPRRRGNVLERRLQRAPSDSIQDPIVESFEYLDSFGGGCCGGGSQFVTSHVDGRGNETTHDYHPLTGDRTKTTHRLVTVGVLGGGNQIIEESWQYNAHGQMIEYENPTGRVDTYSYYNSGPMNGYLERKTVDSTGFLLFTRFEYDDVGNVTKVTDPRLHDTQFVVNQLNQVVRETSREVTDGSGLRYQRDTYYDANDNVVRVDVQNIDDTCEGVLDSCTNTHFTTIHEYDVLNYRTRTCQESGTYTGAIPGPTDLPTCMGLPDSEFITTKFEYDGNKNRTLVRFGEANEGMPLRQPTNVVGTLYDERDLVFKQVRGEDDLDDESITQYDYDQNQNRIRTTVGVGEANPRIHTNTYDSFNRVKTATDPEGNVVTYAYDDNHNRVLMRIDGELIDGESGANVRLSEMDYEYDEMDRLIVTRMAFFDTQSGIDIGDGESTTKTFYDEASYVIRVRNDNDHVADTAFDTANRRSRVTDAKGNIVEVETADGLSGYDANSNVISIKEIEKSDIGQADDEVFFTTNAYDNLDRLIKTVDNDQNTTELGYDSRDNRTVMIDALRLNNPTDSGNVTRYEYDGINRLITTIRFLTNNGTGTGIPAGTIVTTQVFDDTSRLIAQADDKGNTTRYAYDALNRLIVTQMADGTIHQIGSGAAWPKAQPQPDLAGFISGFDVHDNALTTTDANGSVAESADLDDFDLLNRLRRKDVDRASMADGDTVNVLGTTFEVYKYDGLSRLVHAEDDDSLVTRSYDSLSRVTSETLNEQTTDCHYDGVGNALTSTYPGGRVVTNTYDELERKKTISDGGGTIATYNFIGPGRVERRTYDGNNTQCDYAYDNVKRIVRTTHVFDPAGADSIIDKRTYTWDRMFNKTQRKDIRPVGPQLTHKYEYDSIYRLTHTTVTDTVPTTLRDTDYALDDVGNRTKVTGAPDPGPHVGPYTLDPTQPEPADEQMNQYTTTSADARVYDFNGNLIRIDDALPTQRDITYDYRNQMVGYTVIATGERHTYAYDALGRRIVRVVDANGVAGGPTETRYFYDGWRVLEEQNSVGATQATYVYGLYIDEVLNMRRGGSDSYYHTDDLYNVMALTDAAGAVVERYEYADYGQPEFLDSDGNPTANQESAIGNPYLFTGRRYDPETAWYYYRTRYLDPIAGRFTTRDVVGIWGDSLNLGNGYNYVANKSWSYVDPMGLACNTAWEEAIDMNAHERTVFDGAAKLEKTSGLQLTLTESASSVSGVGGKIYGKGGIHSSAGIDVLGTGTKAFAEGGVEVNKFNKDISSSAAARQKVYKKYRYYFDIYKVTVEWQWIVGEQCCDTVEETETNYAMYKAFESYSPSERTGDYGWTFLHTYMTKPCCFKINYTKTTSTTRIPQSEGQHFLSTVQLRLGDEVIGMYDNEIDADAAATEHANN